MKFLQKLLVVIVCLSPFLLWANGSNTDYITIESTWARASAPGAPAAAYMMIHNHSNADDILLQIKGDFAKRLEVHRSFKEDGIMRMEHQKRGVVIPAKGKVSFVPGGYHLMFMGLNKNFAVGEVYTVTLTFKHAGEVVVPFEVKQTNTMGMSH